jgi:hypothetical protein
MALNYLYYRLVTTVGPSQTEFLVTILFASAVACGNPDNAMYLFQYLRETLSASVCKLKTSCVSFIYKSYEGGEKSTSETMNSC